MERYDYHEAMIKDVKEWLAANIDLTEYEDSLDLFYHLNDTLFCEDSVTGNASGSYFCNSFRAEEALCHNLDLLEEALREFGESDGQAYKKGAEYLDVTIRCYLVSSIVDEVIAELQKEGVIA